MQNIRVIKANLLLTYYQSDAKGVSRRSWLEAPLYGSLATISVGTVCPMESTFFRNEVDADSYLNASLGHYLSQLNTAIYNPLTAALLRNRHARGTGQLEGRISYERDI
jgi:hypothetical protein